MPDRLDTADLSADFPAATREDWEALAARASGVSSVSELVTRTFDGIGVAPLCTRGDIGDPPIVPVAPGGAAVRPLIAEPDPDVANAAVLAEIEGGAEQLVLQIEAPGQPGIRIEPGSSDLGRVLTGVDPDAVEVHLRHPTAPGHCLNDLTTWWEESAATEPFRGGFGIDTISAAVTGASEFSRLAEDRLAWDAGVVGSAIDRTPDAAVLRASGLAYHEAGASEAQELAAMLATGVACLRACDDAGVALNDVAPRIALELSADADICLTIAKLRAGRLLWARLLEACGVTDTRARLGVQTSARMMCARDPNVNMLRASCAALAAGIGGADAITVLPFTHAIGRPDEFARRIARNTQIILREESLIGAVGDAAAGSFAIENLTDALCETAWALFRDIEAEGGIIEALAAGSLQRRIAAVRAERARAIAVGRLALVGARALEDAGAVDVSAEPWPAPAALAGDIELIRPISLEAEAMS